MIANNNCITTLVNIANRQAKAREIRESRRRFMAAEESNANPVFCAQVLAHIEEEEDMPSIPEYEPMGSVRVMEGRHPTIAPSYHLNRYPAQPENCIMRHGAADYMLTFAIETIEDARQFGRGMALMAYYSHEGTAGGWHMLRHLFDNKAIRVARDSHGQALVQQAEWSEEGNIVGWKDHKMQRALVINEDPAHPGLFFLPFNAMTYELRHELREAGAQKMQHARQWVFAGRVPDHIRMVQTITSWTKYHFLAKLLQNQDFSIGIARNDNGELMISKEEFAWGVLDGFRRESWVLEGYDWRDFPRPTNSPIKKYQEA